MFIMCLLVDHPEGLLLKDVEETYLRQCGPGKEAGLQQMIESDMQDVLEVHGYPEAQRVFLSHYNYLSKSREPNCMLSLIHI